MSEKFREPAEFDPALAISRVTRDWLQAEIEESMQPQNGNSVLDNWHKFHLDLMLPFDSANNWNAQKAKGHYERLLKWTLLPEEQPQLVENDAFLGQQTWAALMFVSGAYRRQCFFQAADPEDYTHRRKDEGPAAVDLEAIAREHLATGPQVTVYKDTPWGRLQQATLNLNEESFKAAKLVHECGVPGLGREDSEAVRLLTELQEKWAGLAVDYMAFAAQRAGKDWQAVPLLEPKSVSQDPQIYYPFSSGNLSGSRS